MKTKKNKDNKKATTDKTKKINVENNEDQITKLQEELKQITELAKRTMADLQNQKRREEENRSLVIRTANKRLIEDLLPINGNLELAKEHLPEEAKEWFKGVEMAVNQLNEVLKKHGLKEIDAIGKDFNPDLHEALLKGEGEKDKVIAVLEKGYTLGGVVLRHAKVQVGE